MDGIEFRSKIHGIVGRNGLMGIGFDSSGSLSVFELIDHPNHIRDALGLLCGNGFPVPYPRYDNSLIMP